MTICDFCGGKKDVKYYVHVDSYDSGGRIFYSSDVCKKCAEEIGKDLEAKLLGGE